MYDMMIDGKVVLIVPDEKGDEVRVSVHPEKGLTIKTEWRGEKIFTWAEVVRKLL